MGCASTNAEAWIIIEAPGILRNKPVMIVGLKSFAGSYALSPRNGLLDRHVIDFQNARRTKKNDVFDLVEQFNLPVVMGVFTPEWNCTTDIGSIMVDHESSVIVPCGISGNDRWQYRSIPSYGWNAWLALTPQSWEQRLEWAKEFLTKELSVCGDSIPVSQFAKSLGVPLEVAHELGKEITRKSIFRMVDHKEQVLIIRNHWSK